MKANIPILYVGQLRRWSSNPRRKLLVLVVFVFVDLDGWVLQLILLIRGVIDFSQRQHLANRIDVSRAHFVCFAFVSSPFILSETICMVFFLQIRSTLALLF